MRVLKTDSTANNSEAAAKVGINLKVPAYAGHTGFSIVPADTEELRKCVYRLRYFIYVTLMNRKQIYADHAEQIIREPMDEHGLSYLAIRNGEMIGTVRRNLLSDPSTSYYFDFYRGNLFLESGRRRCISITTKLMMLPQFQGSKLSFKLVTSYAEECYKYGIEVDLIDCNAHLIPFFERLGYFTHVGWSVHKEYGRVLPMFFATDVIRYLALIESPFASFAPKYFVDGEYGGYDLIQHLAWKPTSPLIRQVSASFRQSPNSPVWLGVSPCPTF